MEPEAGAAYLKDFGGLESKDLTARKNAFQHEGLRGYWKLLLKQTQDTHQPCSQTITSAHLGDKDRALRALEIGFEHHCDGLQFLSVEPVFDGLRSEPRYQTLIHRMNLPVLQPLI
jgi:hypothetical protein